MTSATANFVSANDAGTPIKQVSDTNIPAGTTISSVSNSTTVILSATCTTANPVTFTLPDRQSKVPSGKGAITLSTGAGAVDILSFSYDGTNINWTLGKTFN
jgi:hypothetical protein